MGCKAAERTCNINNASGPGTANERTEQWWWFKQFCKGDEALARRHSGRPPDADHQLRAITKADPLKLHETLLKKVNCSRSLGI